MMRSKHQFLAAVLPTTDVFVYPGKKKWSIYSPISWTLHKSFHENPIYTVWTNNLEGIHNQSIVC